MVKSIVTKSSSFIARETSVLKVLIVILFLAIIVSLFSGLVFLIKDDSKSNRVLTSLAVRVGLSILLLVVILISLWQGALTINPTP